MTQPSQVNGTSTYYVIYQPTKKKHKKCKNLEIMENISSIFIYVILEITFDLLYLWDPYCELLVPKHRYRGYLQLL